MSVTLSAGDRAFQRELHELLVEEVPSRIRELVLNEQEIGPDDIRLSQRILNEHGLAVPGWPSAWGGRDWTPVQKLIWRAELARAGVPDPLAFNTAMVGPVIFTFGSETLKQRFLPATANLDIWWAQGFSEPGSGSDLASLRTSAVRDGDSYVVSGQKTWTTLAQHADWIFCLVRTDPHAAKPQQGISFLLIDLSSPGVIVRPIRLIDGGYEVNDVFFDEVRVPAENLVGEENQGWTYAKFLLGNERVFSADVSGLQERIARIKPALRPTTSASPARMAMLTRVAEIENDLLALEALWIRAASLLAQDRPVGVLPSVLKLRGSDLSQAITEVELELSGPAAMRIAPTVGSAAGGRYLNARKVTIFGGSSEIQRQLIAATLVGR